MTTTQFHPTAVHIGADELPFAPVPDGTMLKVLQVREREGLWIIQTIFPAGTESPMKLSDYRAGSVLYEPANSVHTLQSVEDDTNVWFHMYGANLNLDADGNVESVTDGASALAGYYALCELAGIPRPNVLVD